MKKTIDYTALAETIRTELNARHDRSAWDKAVTLYALDLLEDIQSHANEHKRAPVDGAELELWALNGADNWHHYSTGACSLVWSAISPRVYAPRLCTSASIRAQASQATVKRGLMYRQTH